MSTAVWTFEFSDGRIDRIPLVHFSAINRGDKAWPEKANQSLKVLSVFLELENRKPKTITQYQGLYLPLNSQGFHNFEKVAKLAIHAMAYAFPVPGKKATSNLRDFYPKYAYWELQKRNWQPTAMEKLDLKRQFFPSLIKVSPS